jgi:hypothetical protein
MEAVAVPTWLAVVIGMLGAVGGAGGIAAFWRSRGENKKLRAEATEIIERTAAKMVERYAEKVNRLEKKVTKLERNLREWQRYAAALWDFICQHGLDDSAELPSAPVEEDGG